MTVISNFSNSLFGNIRVVNSDSNEPRFCLSDICDSLDLSAKGVKQRLEDGVISNYPIYDNLGRTQQALFVNEDGLYDVILDSRKPEAKQFRKWITSEVLPSIRKSGGYIVAKPEETAEDIMAKAILIANETLSRQKEKIEALQEENAGIGIENAIQAKQIEEYKPKVLFADSVSSSEDSILVAELSRYISQNGQNIGQNRLFGWLRQNGYLCQRGELWNQPTQKAMNLGLFEVKKTAINRPDGKILVQTTTKVTGKGQNYFVNKFLNNI